MPSPPVPVLDEPAFKFGHLYRHKDGSIYMFVYTSIDEYNFINPIEGYRYWCNGISAAKTYEYNQTFTVYHGKVIIEE